MNNLTSKIHLTNRLLWIFLGISILFTIFANFYKSGVMSIAFAFAVYLIGALYVYFRKHINKVLWVRILFLIFAALISFSLLINNAIIIDLGYSNSIDVYPIILGSIATYFFISIFIVGTLKGIVRLIALGLVGILTIWVVFPNNGFLF